MRGKQGAGIVDEHGRMLRMSGFCYKCVTLSLQNLLEIPVLNCIRLTLPQLKVQVHVRSSSFPSPSALSIPTSLRLLLIPVE